VRPESTGDRKPYPFVQGPSTERFPAFSPHGRWIAYESNETGRPEIYVRSFPGPGGKWQISTDGGARPLWSRDGSRIFYRNGTKFMAVTAETNSTFTAGKPQELFAGRYFASGHSYDVMPDGKHFLFIQNAQKSGGPTQINVVVNWREELEQHLRNSKPR
jgi:serine/threonine-protein kinase